MVINQVIQDSARKFALIIMLLTRVVWFSCVRTRASIYLHYFSLATTRYSTVHRCSCLMRRNNALNVNSLIILKINNVPLVGFFGTFSMLLYVYFSNIFRRNCFCCNLLEVNAQIDLTISIAYDYDSHEVTNMRRMGRINYKLCRK